MLATGVGLLAEVSLDLEQALLEGGSAEEADAMGAEGAVASETKDGIILARRPGEVAVLSDGLELAVAAEDGAHAEPGEDDVDGKVGDTLGAEERLRLVQARGLEIPVPGPEFIRLALEELEEAGALAGAGEIRGEPVFEALRKVAGGEPLSGEGEAPLGVV
jgi:RNase P/RNase MRP subunit p29